MGFLCVAGSTVADEVAVTGRRWGYRSFIDVRVDDLPTSDLLLLLGDGNHFLFYRFWNRVDFFPALVAG